MAPISSFSPRAASVGGNVAVPLAGTLSGQRNQGKGPGELERGRQTPDRSELEEGPLVSTHTDGCWLTPGWWAQGADPEKRGQGLENRTKTGTTSHAPDRPRGRPGRAKALTSAGTHCSHEVTACGPPLTGHLPRGRKMPGEKASDRRPPRGGPDVPVLRL